jgi:hypothetical protein
MRRLIFVLAVTVLLALNISYVIAAECDRECLIKMADDYISALVTHTPGKVPLSDDVRIIENAKQIKPGEGLWKQPLLAPLNSKL